eukprot:gene13239-18878_t
MPRDAAGAPPPLAASGATPLPVDFVEVVLRTDAEKLAFIDNTNMKKNPNGFILDHDFAVRQWDSPTLGARGYPKLRKGMFVATFGG